jgi:hypothetical protein
MPDQSQKRPPNGTVALLTTLAQSGHAWVQFGTLLLIGIAGLGNWVATWNSANQNRQEIEVSRRVNWEGQEKLKQELIRQVGEIHRWMSEATDEFHKGNEDSAANRKMLTRVMRDDLEGFEGRQLKALENQSAIIQNQAKILEEIHKFVLERKNTLNKNQ